jgi:autotransporter-associated beta strand protein
VYSFYGSSFGGGDANLMGGYLYTTTSSAQTVSFSGLPANQPCALYIYTQGDSAGGGRQLQVTVNGKTCTATSGVASAAAFVAGQNYLSITNVTDGSGNLSFTYTYATENEADINGIQLQLFPKPTDTWVGNTSANFSGLNWTGTNNPPVSGDALVFGTAGTAGTALTANQTAGISYAGITFNSGASAFTIGGANGITLTGGITNNSSSLETLNFPIACPTVQTFATTAGGGNLTLGGVISGAGGISKAGSGTLALSATNTYAGGTTLSAGRLDFKVDDALGSGTFTINGGTTIDASAADLISLAMHSYKFSLLNNPQIWNGDFTFAGTGADDNPTFLYYTLDLGTGPVTLNANCQVTVTQTLTVGGVISGSGYGVTKAGSGTLNLTGNNTYTGPTTVNAGTLELDGSIASGSAVTIASGAVLTTALHINGTAAGTVAVYGTLFPRSSTLNTGPETWYGGQPIEGGYVPGYWVSMDGSFNGTRGVNWSWMNITGTLNIAATSDQPFVIYPATPLEAVFDNTQDYTWCIATASGGVTGFDASKFTIVPSDYFFDLGVGSFATTVWPGIGTGQFIVTQSGNDVNLQFVHVVAHPVTVYRAFGTYLRLPVATVLASVSGGADPYTLTSVTSENPNDYVQISGTNILFAPANPNAPSSTLDYSVQSVYGAPAYTASNTITVAAINAAGISRSITITNGQPMVFFAGMPGSQYMVQRSTDLINWTNLDGRSGTTNSIITTSAAGVWTFTDPNPPEGSAFYRAVQAYVSVIWGGLNPTYDGTAKSVTATSSPPGMTVNLVYYDGGGNPISPPTGAGSYTVVGTISHGSYSGSATNTLTIAKATATITLTDNGDGTASATTSPDGLTVNFNYTPSDIDDGATFVMATISDANYTGVAYGSVWVNPNPFNPGNE